MDNQKTSLEKYRKELEKLSDDDLEILHDTYPSNIYVKGEWERRKKLKEGKGE